MIHGIGGSINFALRPHQRPQSLPEGAHCQGILRDHCDNTRKTRRIDDLAAYVRGFDDSTREPSFRNPER
jgi:hypothetical protein